MKRIESIKDLYDRFGGELAKVKERIRAAVTEGDAGEDTKRILLEQTENTGKMVRPLLMMCSAGDVSVEAREKLLWSAAALEILHTSTLILDDIIDGADLRRGKPSAFAEYGTGVAICAGDYLLATSFDCLLTRGWADVAHDLVKLTKALCDGELIQDYYRNNTDVTEDIYMRAISGKTAAAFSFVCETGARIGGADEKTCRIMSLLGMTLGRMFQIRDDILDLTRDEKELGKPAGEDFRCGNYTLPVIYALANKEARAELMKNTENADDMDFEKVKKIIAESGGIDYAKRRLAGLEKEALTALSQVPDNGYQDAFRLLIAMCATA